MTKHTILGVKDNGIKQFLHPKEKLSSRVRPRASAQRDRPKQDPKQKKGEEDV